MFQPPTPTRFGVPPQTEGSRVAKLSPCTSGTHSGGEVSTRSGLTRICGARAKLEANSKDSGPPVTRAAWPRAGTTTQVKSKKGQKPVR